MVAVGRKRHAGVVIADVLSCKKARPVRPDDVVKHSCTPAKDETTRTIREPNQREKTWPYFLGHAMQGLVEGLFELVEVSDYGGDS